MPGTVADIVTDGLLQVIVAELDDKVTCGALELPYTVAVDTAVHPLADVTFTEYTPADPAINVAVLEGPTMVPPDVVHE